MDFWMRTGGTSEVCVGCQNVFYYTVLYEHSHALHIWGGHVWQVYLSSSSSSSSSRSSSSPHSNPRAPSSTSLHEPVTSPRSSCGARTEAYIDESCDTYMDDMCHANEYGMALICVSQVAVEFVWRANWGVIHGWVMLHIHGRIVSRKWIRHGTCMNESIRSGVRVARELCRTQMCVGCKVKDFTYSTARYCMDTLTPYTSEGDTSNLCVGCAKVGCILLHDIVWILSHPTHLSHRERVRGAHPRCV